MDPRRPPFLAMYSRGYNPQRLEVRETAEYARWFRKLRDDNARARVLVRIRRLSLGNFGLVEPVGHGVSELKIDYGPGYRIYVKRIADDTVLLLVGGDKRTQKQDIERAQALARGLKRRGQPK